MLHRTLQRTERLRPLAVLAAVPEEERAVRGAGNGHGPPVGRTDTMGEGRAVLKLARRNVTGCAGDLTVRAETRIEEESLAERRGGRVVGNAVRRIGRQRFQFSKRQ